MSRDIFKPNVKFILNCKCAMYTLYCRFVCVLFIYVNVGITMECAFYCRSNSNSKRRQQPTMVILGVLCCLLLAPVWKNSVIFVWLRNVSRSLCECVCRGVSASDVAIDVELQAMSSVSEMDSQG